jgi:hypothetical protein
VLYNQFSPPGSDRLAETYGASSPMGLLWTFMGSSRAYTAFSGYMETLGALLLLWRRTALLGALTSICVLFNVMVLNFCYDVPVKLFSFHLVLIGACIALPDARRLVQLFLGFGGASASDAASTLAYPFTGRAGTRVHRALKGLPGRDGAGPPALTSTGARNAPSPPRCRPSAHGSSPSSRSTASARAGVRRGRVADAEPAACPTESGWTTDCFATRVDGSATSAKAT